MPSAHFYVCFLRAYIKKKKKSIKREIGGETPLCDATFLPFTFCCRFFAGVGLLCSDVTEIVVYA